MIFGLYSRNIGKTRKRMVCGEETSSFGARTMEGQVRKEVLAYMRLLFHEWRQCESPVLKRTASFLVLVALIFVPAISLSADGLGHGWRRSGISFWGEQPQVNEGASPNGIAVELVLPPGANVSYARKGNWSFDNAVIRMSTDLVVPTGNEYMPGEAKFPASVTFVYGEDKLPIGFWVRFRLFFKEAFSGFRPSGIRLTYAWGTMLPVGSMYRLWEEETVFILAGPEEAEKEITTARMLSEDFKAAYGRPPKGLVTEVRVEARNPSKAKAPAKTSITLKYPLE